MPSSQPCIEGAAELAHTTRSNILAPGTSIQGNSSARSLGVIKKYQTKRIHFKYSDPLILTDLLRDKEYIFRGQWNHVSVEDLVPKLDRILKMPPFYIDDKKINDIEKTLFDKFKASVPKLTKSINNDWDLLAIAQHHGLPTRLLDWTFDPKVALWFSVHGYSKSANDYSVVWALEKDLVPNLHSIGKKESPFKIGETVLFEPKDLPEGESYRVSAQKSLFTVHHNKSILDHFYHIGNVREKKLHRLHKIKIYRVDHDAIRKALDEDGINEAYVYGDLDSLSRHLEWKYYKY